MTKLTEKLQQNVDNLFKENSEGRNLPKEFRISELPYCNLKSYYRRKLGIQSQQNAKMFMGNLCHEKLPQIVKGIKEIKDPEFEVECKRDFKDFSIAGHCDILTDDCVYEFKFSGSDLKKYPDPIHWIIQANAYATLLNVPKWNILQLNSQSLIVDSIPGLQSDIMFDVLLDKARELYWSLVNNKPPDGPAYNWECNWCEVRNFCENYLKGDKDETCTKL